MYLSKSGKRHANYILNQLLILPQNNETLSLIESILKEILNEDLPEYSENELYYINNLILEISANDSEAKWSGEKKEFTTSSGIRKNIPKRKASIAADAFRIANNLYEYDNDHKVLLRKNGKTNYTEQHHLIPMSKHSDFDYNLDTEENIISLCSHCHNLLYYARLEDKTLILKNLYAKRKDVLRNVGLCLDNFEDLEKYYI